MTYLDTLRLVRNVLLRTFAVGVVFALVMLVATLAAWPVWTGLATRWSTAPDTGLENMQRALLYVGLFALAVIGAGSTYTPELVSGLMLEQERLAVRELVLHDIDAERLEVVGGLAERMLERQGYRGALTLTGELSRADKASKRLKL